MRFIFNHLTAFRESISCTLFWDIVVLHLRAHGSWVFYQVLSAFETGHIKAKCLLRQVSNGTIL